MQHLVQRGCWLALAVLILTLAACGGASSTQVSTTQAQPTAKPTQAHIAKWTTVQTFKGNGIKKTATFAVPDDWKLTWTCNPSSFFGNQYNVIVTVYNADNTPADVAVNALCKKGTTSDTTEEHQAGTVYLSINSEGAWAVQVQELK